MTIDELTGEVGNLEFRLNNRLMALETKNTGLTNALDTLKAKMDSDSLDVRTKIMLRDKAILEKLAFTDSTASKLEKRTSSVEVMLNNVLKSLTDMGNTILKQPKTVVERLKDLIK